MFPIPRKYPQADAKPSDPPLLEHRSSAPRAAQLIHPPRWESASPEKRLANLFGSARLEQGESRGDTRADAFMHLLVAGSTFLSRSITAPRPVEART
jgi:hypothetical protein